MIKPFIVWIISFLLFVFLILLTIKGDVNLPKQAEIALAVMFGALFLTGIISFSMFVSRATGLILKKINRGKNTFIKIFNFFLVIFAFPIFLFLEFVKPSLAVQLVLEKRFREIFSFKTAKYLLLAFLTIVIVIPLWIFIFSTVGVLSFNLISAKLGYLSESIPVSGTGSMYPTFPKGIGKDPKELGREIVGYPGMLPYPNGIVLNRTRYFDYKLQRGDIIVFENKETEKITNEKYGSPAGFVKRLIGLPGDTIELRNGIVYLNNKPLAEPYTAKAHSTFAGEFLPECKKVKIPKNKLFAMGDNRKGSGDSREIGFVDFSDVDHVLPTIKQTGVWDKNYRDTENDFSELTKIRIDKEKYLQLLNEKRKQAGRQPLKYEKQLEQSAFKRGEIMLEYNDFSFEATKSGYPMLKALDDVGYSNITYGETYTHGYFDAQEVIENQFQFPETEKFLLNNDNQEIGIAEVEGEINNCPTQVIVFHFAGYVPPNYSEEDISGWGKLINNMDEVIPSWEKGLLIPEINKDDLNKLIGLLYQRKRNAESIYYAMKANKWLTPEQQKFTEIDDDLYEQAKALTEKLN